ncbi:hypothetical protein R1sor_024411 [Riccia sorocarpa]|uniref:Uncharacterized protein n=1 Tax=Riccia sorocarpa TaxID=122646 RepID=A0ABD3GTN6_9MARC
MPRESDRHLIGKQLTHLMEMNILDEDSSSSSDNDLEMLYLLCTDDESGSSSGDSDRDPDLSDDSDSEGDDEIGDLAALLDVVEQGRYLTRSLRYDFRQSCIPQQFSLPAGGRVCAVGGRVGPLWSRREMVHVWIEVC